MNNRAYVNTLLSINAFYEKTYTELLNLSPKYRTGNYCAEQTGSGSSAGIGSEYSGFIYNDEIQHYLPRRIFGKNIEIPYFSSLKLCESISEHAFNLLYFALKTTKDFATGKIDQRLLASMCIKNSSRVNLSTCEESQGSSGLTLDVINRINQGEAEWGLVLYFSADDYNQRSGIFIQLIHKYFTNVFFIPVDYTFGNDLHMAIQTN